MLDATERMITRKALKGAMMPKKIGKLSLDYISLHSYMDLHTSSNTNKAARKDTRLGSTDIPVGCSCSTYWVDFCVQPST